MVDASSPPDFFLTDAGMHTVLIFEQGEELPGFSAIVMLKTEERRKTLRDYYRSFLDMARKYGHGFILCTNSTWHSSRDQAAAIGLSAEEILELNKVAVELALDLKKEYPDVKIVVDGLLGPKGDGYNVDEKLTVAQACEYHQEQIDVLASAGADRMCAATLTYPSEAAGIVLAARKAKVPVVIGFTVQTDGTLPDGTDLEKAIEWVDKETDGGPEYYLLNCSHMDHITPTLKAGATKDWLKRVGGLR